MDHVAATAGVSKALVYQHFPSKEELFAAATQQVVDGVMGPLPGVLSRDGDVLGAWRGVVGLLCDLVTQRPQAWAFVARHANHPELGALLRGMWEQISEAFTVVLAGTHEPQVAMVSEQIVVEHSRLTVALIVSALQGLMSWWLEHPELPRAEVEAWAVDFGWLILDRIQRGQRLRAVNN
jgi:AcrR family transcriptional regulator